ncbi:DUF4177 domain-containing protein [Viridibacillus arvi]|uniref:DUF4177 domain-containing protein n=1 Tax=Viridibacillus arvi TaxID=263475 RepID=UPI003D2D7DD8
MYEYKFIQIELKQKILKAEATEDYREIIREHAEKGWRLVQIFAPGTLRLVPQRILN